MEGHAIRSDARDAGPDGVQCACVRCRHRHPRMCIRHRIQRARLTDLSTFLPWLLRQILFVSGGKERGWGYCARVNLQIWYIGVRSPVYRSRLIGKQRGATVQWPRAPACANQRRHTSAVRNEKTLEVYIYSLVATHAACCCRKRSSSSHASAVTPVVVGAGAGAGADADADVSAAKSRVT